MDSEEGGRDSKPLKRIYLSPPHMGGDERALLLDAFDSNWIAPLGPHVDAFEREFAAEIGASNAVALSSGTAALQLALELVGVGPGEEVLTSTLTFAATANAIVYRGARPVFVDCDATWTLAPPLLVSELETRARAGKLPKAVLAVDLYGQCADYDAIRAACARWEIPIVEDAAEALGATYRGRAAGTLGDVNAFSFNGNKIITTSGGGMLTSERADWCDRARFLATQARDPAPHYEHSTVGYNFRLSNLLAAVGRGQLHYLAERVARRRAIRERYRAALGRLPGIEFMPEADYGKSNAWLTCLTVDANLLGVSREDIRLGLERNNVEARPVWKPMHLQPVFAACTTIGGAFAADLFARGLCLPSGSSLSDNDVDFVIETILRIVRRAAA